ncbi:hypothetical protein JXA48_04140 [Candidatus Woesearchaeota archaeon]|nr:hypothetical protein [Candidatus Woesearchaeota archaeon]
MTKENYIYERANILRDYVNGYVLNPLNGFYQLAVKLNTSSVLSNVPNFDGPKAYFSERNLVVEDYLSSETICVLDSLVSKLNSLQPLSLEKKPFVDDVHYVLSCFVKQSILDISFDSN